MILSNYESDNSTLIWKHLCEDFNTTTQLIVYKSQEAILFLNGQALDLFDPGGHTLETQNIPILRRLINIPTGGKTAVRCEVYFINKTEQIAIRWGTDSKVAELKNASSKLEIITELNSLLDERNKKCKIIK